MNASLIHISLGGPVRCIAVGSKLWWFEDHPYCGPVVVHKKTHDPLMNQPPEASPFWQAVNRWSAAGKPVGHGGRALYTAGDLGQEWRGRHRAAASLPRPEPGEAT